MSVIEINVGDGTTTKKCGNCMFWSDWGSAMPGWGRCHSAASTKSGDDTKAGSKCARFRNFLQAVGADK